MESLEKMHFHDWMRKIGSALLYAVCSLLLMTINKSVLTSYGFPSYEVLGFAQMVTTVVVLSTTKAFIPALFPNPSPHVFRKVAPLSLIFAGNLFFGLGGTKMISLPMFTVLRRFSILFTMFAEYWFLRVIPSRSVQIAVYGMILGSVVAAAHDLSFTYTGYFFVLMNDVFTAANAICIKKILNSKELGEYGLMLYSSALMLIPSLVYTSGTGQLSKAMEFAKWTDWGFFLRFGISCIMGFVINYSVVLCTHYNSALTTTVIGALKNILTVYFGMYVGGDYIFDVWNFLGLNISVVASLLYSYVVFFESERKQTKAVRVCTGISAV
ncbi:UDP-sugar transporter UST74c-like [Paramacrobiotus metropolitanus]|uniref:UDP-sugar transporter UST74c-like n=1 Tax=Paramacrobiotus metropolitanus TaxID=2943436 RepID=UPI0024461247|nr:UDP-sugar transporter UST74c-like [Paramacrobiotus metropolitanus]XP_055350456.1 UDP-sugar transporter UST74c-like [Paramacrobiotus metropolitanus]